MRLSRRNFVKTAAGLVLPAWAAGGASIIIAPPRYSSFGPIYDAEVTDWVARVVANGGSVSTATKNAANDFITGLNTDGLRSLIWRLNFFASDSYAGVLVPFIVNTSLSFAQNALEDARKTASSSAATVSDWIWSESVGLQPNTGSQAFLYTGFDVRNYNADLGSAHFAIDVITGLNETSGSGFQDSAAGFRGFIHSHGPINTGQVYIEMHNTGTAIYTDSAATGLFMGSRTSTTLLTLYRNGVSKATDTTGTATYASGSNCTIFALNATTIQQFTSKAFGGYSIGLKFDSTQQLNFYNRWRTLQTALGRP